VSIAVVVGNRVARIVGTITVMGRFWVVVNVEESEIESLGGVVFLNKGSIVAYVPLPDNNTKA
jgi:2-polyprenyl-6-methoxyphenol hydroxylase-like FAD-dependent oxidoreductase